jgi:hypothetical protein
VFFWCPGTGLPSERSLLRQFYSVASLMCSSAAISEMVLLFGGNNFLRIAAFLSSEYLGIVSSISPPLLDFWAIQDLDNYPDTGGHRRRCDQSRQARKNWE